MLPPPPLFAAPTQAIGSDTASPNFLAVGKLNSCSSSEARREQSKYCHLLQVITSSDKQEVYYYILSTVMNNHNVFLDLSSNHSI